MSSSQPSVNTIENNQNNKLPEKQLTNTLINNNPDYDPTNNQNADIYFDQGCEYISRGKYDIAKQSFKEAYLINPNLNKQCNYSNNYSNHSPQNFPNNNLQYQNNTQKKKNALKTIGKGILGVLGAFRGSYSSRPRYSSYPLLQTQMQNTMIPINPTTPSFSSVYSPPKTTKTVCQSDGYGGIRCTSN